MPAAQPTFPTANTTATVNVEDPVSNAAQTVALANISTNATISASMPAASRSSAEHDEAQLTTGGANLSTEIATANTHISANATFNTPRPGVAAEHVE